ncbi:MAG: hypothetical protein WC222_07955 [Parachlamydiales bacterium]|jgi:hypothetical protein
MELINDKLLEYNSLGLFPGPEEEEADYYKRVDYCLHLRTILSKDHGSIIPPEVMEAEDQPLTEEAWQVTRPLFGIAPLWTPLFFSNHQLAPWHGGCAWIFRVAEDSPIGAIFQLRRSFKKKEIFLGYYKRSFLLAHEGVHVARMAFEEPKFEEILAYMTSQSAFQRFIGPLAESSKETAIFALLIFVSMVISLTAGTGVWPLWMVGINLLPWLMIIAACIRRIYRQSQLDRCLKNLKQLTSQANHVACRLTDKEIILFAGYAPEEITRYAAENKEFRWSLLRSYFS